MESRPDETIGEPTPLAGQAGQSAHVGEERPGDMIGPYKLVSLLGHGGMGEVWLADRRLPYEQRVALKLIKAGMDSKSVLARFEQERQALAVMNHPGIAKVLDGGMTPSGRPYFAMEFVKGEPLTDFCDRAKLGIEDRLRLFEQACEAVQHAHLKGIVHRDLKPSNILAFTVEGEGPHLKVIDFGVSKAMSHRMSEHTIFTESGQMIGTPEYMSPEQADPNAGDIDTRSDIYSLGVLLYELLVGATPFDSRELRKKAYGEIQRILREQDPQSPSARLSTMVTKDKASASRIEAARKLRTDDLVKRLRNELEWIPLKAMRKERQLRYQTAMALAEDVRNYLEGKPLVAAPESTAYRVRKYVKRNRALVAGAGAVVASLLVGFGTTLWQAGEAARQRDAALDATAAAVANEQAARREKAEADAARANADESARAAADSEAKAIAEGEHTKDLLAVVAMGTALEAARGGDRRQLDRDLASLAEIGRADRFPARLALALSNQETRAPLRGHSNQVVTLAFSPDGQTLASGSWDRTIRLWESATGKPIGILDGHEGSVSGIAFSPDGRTLASAGGPGVLNNFSNRVEALDNTIRLWDLATRKPKGEPIRGHEEGVEGIAFSADGKSLASTGSRDNAIRLWDVGSGNPVGELLLQQALTPTPVIVSAMAFNPDRKVLARATSRNALVAGTVQVLDSTIRLLDTSTGKPIGEPLRGHKGFVSALAFSRDGQTLASAGREDRTIRLWNATTGDPIGEPIRGGEIHLGSLAFSPDGKVLASASKFGPGIRLWDVATGKQVGEPLHGHELGIGSLVFSPDGRRLASAGVDCSIRLWDVDIREHLDDFLPARSVGLRSVAFSPDGRIIAAGAGSALGLATHDDVIRLWDALTGQQLGEALRGHENGVTSVAFSPDGEMLASTSLDNTIRLWNVATGAPVGEPLRGHVLSVTCAAFSPDGKILASGGGDKLIRLWDALTGKPQGEALRGHEGPVTSIAFSPDGSKFATASGLGPMTMLPGASRRWEGTIRLWDAATYKPIGEPLGGQLAPVSSVAFSPDGRTLASASNDRSITLWDVATGKQFDEPMYGHVEGINSVAFSPDGTTLATGSGDFMESGVLDRTVRLWDAVTRQQVGEPLVRADHGVNCVAFSPDRNTLVGGSEDGTIRLWSAVPIRERFGPVSQRLAQAEQVRETLSAQVAAVGLEEADVAAFQAAVVADSRFAGELRLPAMMVVGELAQDREAARLKRLWERRKSKSPQQPTTEASRGGEPRD